MATIQQTHSPILTSNAQVLILPLNSAGIILDPVLSRCKTLYADNYQLYQRACRDGSLTVGDCLLHKRQREQVGLSVSHNGNQPDYIANLIVSDHPYHATRRLWLTEALRHLQTQLLPLIRYQGVRKVALFARPLIFDISPSLSIDSQRSKPLNNANIIPLDWQSITLPLIIEHLQDLPKLRIEVHVPKSIALD